MRVLMVNKYARITGGADKQCMSLATALRDEGHEVAFLAMASPENTERRGVFVPTSVTHETRDSLSARARARVLRDAVWNPAAAGAMEQLIDDFRPDVVHAHRLYPQLSVSSIRVARRRGLPIVQTLHDYEFLSANPFDPSGGVFDRHEQRTSYGLLNACTFAIRRLLHVPAVTEWIAVSNFVAQAHFSRGIRATVIPNFAELDSSGSPLPLERRGGVLFLGALSEEKGALDILELARVLPDVRVVIAGRGPLRAQVAAVAANLGNIDFRGHLDSASAAEAIRSARLVVIPSRWEEPGALVALEAMTAGTPIVAYSRGGLAEYVTSAGAGLTVETDPRLLASACQTLLTDAERWRECAAAGIRASESTFSREAHTAAVLAVYERAAGRAGEGNRPAIH
jgi:glycosyltransferase involved in cell wall biosynthesis